MSYQIHITSTAEHDIMRAADYIEFTLKNPDAADNLLDAATEQIGSLADLPQKFRLVDDPVLASWGIRFVIINNYLAFYTIDEEKQTVIIVRFLYQKSNWTSILRQISPSFNHYSSHQILIQAQILARCSHKLKNAVQSSQIVLHFLNTGGFLIFCYNLM